MKKRSNGFVSRLCIYLGLGLLVSATVVQIVWQWSMDTAAEKSAAYVAAIRTHIPEPESAAPEARRDNAMPVLSIDGTDFIGIVEMPRFGSSLPVGANWGKVSNYPCCLSGSVYDRTIQIGGTAQKGQYDFYREISVGDAVFFTDMEGNRFSYAVADIRYEKHADQAALQQVDDALTLFIKNIYGFEYIIIYCTAL